MPRLELGAHLAHAVLIGAFSATVAAFCEIVQAFVVLWPWMLAIAVMSFGGPAA